MNGHSHRLDSVAPIHTMMLIELHCDRSTLKSGGGISVLVESACSVTAGGALLLVFFYGCWFSGVRLVDIPRISLTIFRASTALNTVTVRTVLR